MICINKKELETGNESDALYQKGGALEYLSASRVNCWRQCRRKFYFRYVKKLPSKPTAALHLGKVLHATLQAWNHARWSRKPLTRIQLEEACSRLWQKEQQLHPVQWKSADEEGSQKEKAISCLRAYLDSQVIPEDEAILAVEVRLEATFDGLPPLVGIVDLVREGGVIVDFKTTAKTPDLEVTEFTHDLQLTTYAVLFRETTGFREQGVQLHHIVKTKTPKVVVQDIEDIDDAKVAGFKEVLHHFVRSVEKEDWSASPNFMCGGCDYFQQCKHWKGGGDQ